MNRSEATLNSIMTSTQITTTTIHPSATGGVTEYHTLVRITDPMLSFREQMEAVLESLTQSEAQPLFRRFFLSDAATQQPLLEEALAHLPACATSIVQQPPLDGTKIALWQWSATDLESDFGAYAHNGYLHYWMGGSIPYQSADIHTLGRIKNWAFARRHLDTVMPPRTTVPAAADPEYQMRDLFDAWRCELRAIDMTIADHALRTWIFVHDVDVNYGGVVAGRRKYFSRIGLTPDTHYIASTGIEGRHALPEVLVQMDGYAVRGLQSSQISYLQAPDYLNPTYEYGVTFERGTAVTYGDRRHVFISGTASIDREGKVVHEGDVILQTDRMLTNVEALLAKAECTMTDIVSAIVYLRDPADAQRVRQHLAERLPALPYLLVHAPVCRPAWLIEMECIAARPLTDDRYAPF